VRKSLILAATVAAVGSAATITGVAAGNARTATTKAKLAVRHGPLGTFVVDGKGLTLYMFEKDKHGKSACSGTCAKVWAPLLTSGKPSGASGIAASKIGTVKRTGGATQVTYGGHPLYHYDDDHKPGQTVGQDSHAFGAGWYVVAPSGRKIDES
jgi:predicted lipoprotein with Yx(FWY)xxD motif